MTLGVAYCWLTDRRLGEEGRGEKRRGLIVLAVMGLTVIPTQISPHLYSHMVRWRDQINPGTDCRSSFSSVCSCVVMAICCKTVYPVNLQLIKIFHVL